MRLLIASTLLLLAHAGSVLAAACLSNATGNWNAAATWTSCGGGFPGTADTAQIRNAHTVTLTAPAAASSVSITSATGAGTTTILDVAGQTLTIGGGTGGLSLTGGAGTRRARLALSTGTVNAGTVSILGTAGNAQITFSGAGALNLTGDLPSGATFTASTGTVHFNGTVAQTIGAYAYNILKVNNAAGASLTSASSADTLTIGDITANSLFTAGFALASTGTLNLTSGTLKLGSPTAAVAFPAFATTTIAAGTTVEYAAGPNGQVVSTAPAYQTLTFSGAGSKFVATGTLSVAENWTAGSAVRLDINNSIVNVAGNLIAAGSITQGTGSMTIGGGWQNDGTFAGGAGGVALTGDLTGTGSVIQGNGLITITGSWLNTGAFTAGAGGVTLNGAGQQITGPAAGITFTTLTVNGTYTNSNATGVTVSTALGGTGTLTQSANSVLSLGGTSAISNLDASASPNTVIYNGGAGQLVKATPVTPVSLPYHHLTINNASGVTLAGDVAVNGIVTLTAGNVSTGANKLTINSTGSVTGAATARHIVGNLERQFLAAGSFTYDVGDGTNYTPITVNMGTLTTTGLLTASVTNTEHPDSTAVASGVDPTLSINRYWTLKNSSLAGTLTATLNYINGTPIDRDAAAVAADFVIRRGDTCTGTGATRTCPSWSAVSVSGTPTTTQAIGSAIAIAVAAPEADFAVGEALIVSFSREQEYIYSRELY